MNNFRRRALGFLVGAWTLLALPALAQESPEAPSPPSVTWLAAEARNNLIRLIWTDSPEALGPVFVYRSETPFDETPPESLSAPVEVPYGVQSYIDQGKAQTTYYYYIAASDEEGQQYQVRLPGANSTSITLREVEGPDLSATALEWAAARGPGLESLEARTQEDSVVITYRLQGAAFSEVILYRSVQPIVHYRDLLNAVILQSGVSSPFVDYPAPGIPAYYAAILEDDLSAGQVLIRRGVNATIHPVEVPPGPYRVGLPRAAPIRSLPLPLISVYTAAPWPEGLSSLPPPQPLSPEAAKAVAELRSSAPPQERPPRRSAMSPRAFQEDLEHASLRGEHYALGTIVQGPFSKRDWAASREELLRFLSLPHSAPVEARARFYLAQTYYFFGLFREALFEFLSAQSSYPREADEWIAALLSPPGLPQQ